MIQVEGYKAFRGTMRITPKNPQFPQQEIHGDWLYNLSTGAGMVTARALWPKSVKSSQTKRNERMIDNAYR